jgi:hypothetical protein
MEQTLDLCSGDDIIYADINSRISILIICVNFDGIVNYSFDFTSYIGATLTVKDESESIIMTFSTLDGSIVLKDRGVFELIKDNNEISGKYDYQMYLSSEEDSMINFISGKIIF